MTFGLVNFYIQIPVFLQMQIVPSSKRLSSITAQRKPLGSTVDRSVQAYHSMNKLLAAFLEHVSAFVNFNFIVIVFLTSQANCFFCLFYFYQALKDLDYEVRSKLFLESVLDMEFAQTQDKGVLYIGKCHHK